jgi:hypothetical protein
MNNLYIVLLCWLSAIVGFISGAAWCGLFRKDESVLTSERLEEDEWQ